MIDTDGRTVPDYPQSYSSEWWEIHVCVAPRGSSEIPTPTPARPFATRFLLFDYADGSIDCLKNTFITAADALHPPNKDIECFVKQLLELDFYTDQGAQLGVFQPPEFPSTLLFPFLVGRGLWSILPPSGAESDFGESAVELQPCERYALEPDPNLWRPISKDSPSPDRKRMRHVLQYMLILLALHHLSPYVDRYPNVFLWIILGSLALGGFLRAREKALPDPPSSDEDRTPPKKRPLYTLIGTAKTADGSPIESPLIISCIQESRAISTEAYPDSRGEFRVEVKLDPSAGDISLEVWRREFAGEFEVGAHPTRATFAHPEDAVFLSSEDAQRGTGTYTLPNDTPLVIDLGVITLADPPSALHIVPVAFPPAWPRDARCEPRSASFKVYCRARSADRELNTDPWSDSRWWSFVGVIPNQATTLYTWAAAETFEIVLQDVDQPHFSGSADVRVETPPRSISILENCWVVGKVDLEAYPDAQTVCFAKRPSSAPSPWIALWENTAPPRSALVGESGDFFFGLVLPGEYRLELIGDHERITSQAVTLVSGSNTVSFSA